MATSIKFCGMTRPADVAYAAELGAEYVGVIFAGGPRRLTVEQAKPVFAAAPPTVKRVGVFANQSIDDIRNAVETLGLSVVQLHADPSGAQAAQVREAVGGKAKVWPVVRLHGVEIPSTIDEVVASADALLIDAKVAGALGGTGVTLPWAELRGAIEPFRKCPLVLAGGLTAANVREAIDALRPDVVDVASGVESAPGEKDHEQMRLFSEAVRRAHRA
jgi:phosphoribosylanthranilate isomerase